ncbi:MAG: RusA family crossover junction endodeoxyribonuclease [Rheinheimera sp.]|nr:RusA family crossover junction endodeoxyribonuclease [Rheinheimera sp.]
MISLTLPLPPSLNSYWRSTATNAGCLTRSVRTTRTHSPIKVYISQKGQAFRTEVIAAVLQARANKKLTGRLQVDLIIHPADRRVQDIDNRIKATLDALTHAGVYVDDSQIDRLIVCRGEIIKGGKCQVLITGLQG